MNMLAKTYNGGPDDAGAALMRVIAREGWEHASLSAVAKEADIPLAKLVETTGSLFDLLMRFGRAMDSTAIRTADMDGETPRDRLFDLLMARFEAVLPHRSALRILMRATTRDPVLAAFFAATLPGAMARMLDAAGISTQGIAGQIRIHGLGLVHLSVVRTFLDDDSTDLSATMAALDKALARAERTANRLWGGQRRSAEPDMSDAA